MQATETIMPSITITVLQHIDAVSVADCGEPVGYDEGRSSLQSISPCLHGISSFYGRFQGPADENGYLFDKLPDPADKTSVSVSSHGDLPHPDFFETFPEKRNEPEDH